MTRLAVERVPARYYSINTNASMAQNITTVNYDAMYREYAGALTPGFFSVRRHKALPDNPYQMTLHRSSGASISTYTERKVGENRYFYSSESTNALQYGGSAPFSFQPSTMVTEARNKAFLRLASQCSGVQFNAAQFFAERHQLADMLASTATRVTQAALALKRADPKAFSRALSLPSSEMMAVQKGFKAVERTPAGKRLANHWLEYVYGWKPLLSDAFSAADLVAKKVSDVQRPITGTMRSSAFLTRPVTVMATRGGLPHLTVDYYTTHSVRVRQKVVYALQSEARSALAQTGISNPLLLGWELLPYSFVVDWFFPVGNYLESLTAFDGFAFSGSTVSVLESSASVGAVGYDSGTIPDNYYVTSVAGGAAVRTSVRYSRQPGYIADYIPVVKNPIGGEPVSRFLTAFSLLTQLFTGSTKRHNR